jgi:hypothetical protein
VGNGLKSSFLTVNLILSYPLFMARALRIKYKNAFGKIHNTHRRIFMDMLYCYTGLSNRETGELIALDYIARLMWKE